KRNRLRRVADGQELRRCRRDRLDDRGRCCIRASHAESIGVSADVRDSDYPAAAGARRIDRHTEERHRVTRGLNSLKYVLVIAGACPGGDAASNYGPGRPRAVVTYSAGGESSPETVAKPDANRRAGGAVGFTGKLSSRYRLVK